MANNGKCGHSDPQERMPVCTRRHLTPVGRLIGPGQFGRCQVAPAIHIHQIDVAPERTRTPAIGKSISVIRDQPTWQGVQVRSADLQSTHLGWASMR
jgi:hypothetical protein